jgi:phytoene dehydrogenase-like protein
MDKKFDAIFIGSGHNALLAAAYVARAGWRVLVVEKNDRPGGLVRTEELTLPGFRHDTYSSAHPLFVTSQAYADLGPELAERGLRYLNTDLPTGVSLPDGRTAVFSRDLAANVEDYERLSPGDGTAFQLLMEEYGARAGDIFPLFGLDLSSPEASPYLKRLMADEAGRRPSRFAAETVRTARDVLERTFLSPVLRALPAPWVWHLGRTTDSAGSGPWVPLTLMALMGGGMAIPEGGSEMLARALARLIEDHGGVLRMNMPVERIVVRHGRAAGVVLADGREVRAERAVVASVNRDQLYLRLLADADVRPAVRREAAEYRYGRGCVQIHLALSEPPRWADERMARVGQPHLTPGLDGCTLQVAQALAGLLPSEPTVSFDAPAGLDPSRAPAGKATLRLQMLEIPCRPQGDAAGTIEVGDGTWTEDLKRRFMDRVLEIVGRHVPNVPGAVLGYHVLSPDDLARFSPNQGPGDPYGGSHELAQSYLFRPLPSQPSHQTEVPGLYLLGAATWPGHGVNGGSGYIVARKLLAGTESRGDFARTEVAEEVARRW